MDTIVVHGITLPKLKCLEDHSLEIPAYLARNEDGSMKYPGVVTAAVKPAPTSSDPFVMTPEELGRQKDRQAIKQIKAAQTRDANRKESEDARVKREMRQAKRAQEEKTLQKARHEYFAMRKPSWTV